MISVIALDFLSDLRPYMIGLKRYPAAITKSKRLKEFSKWTECILQESCPQLLFASS